MSILNEKACRPCVDRGFLVPKSHNYIKSLLSILCILVYYPQKLGEANNEN